MSSAARLDLAARSSQDSGEVPLLAPRAGAPSARSEETLDASLSPREAVLASDTQLAATLEGDSPRSAPDGFPVTEWDRYEFVRVLGHGGMGTVYEARDLRLGRAVALKFIRGGDPKLTMRLLREARAQARIEHEGVCKVYEVGEIRGKPYIAMALIEGRALGDAASGMSLTEKVVVIRDVALALHAAHTLGILHRDVKPSNIMVEVLEDARLRPVVMDFGVARDEGGERDLTVTGALLGTPAYMAPEQARGGRDLDRRADVYSLGVTLFELLAGRPPFLADTPIKTVIAALHTEPPLLRSRAPSAP